MLIGVCSLEKVDYVYNLISEYCQLTYRSLEKIIGISEGISNSTIDGFNSINYLGFHKVSKMS